MSQAEGQQKNLVQCIDSLPTKGPLSCLDQDLLLLKATSAATLSCLGECLNILQQTQSHGQEPPQSHTTPRNHAAPSGEFDPGPIPVLVLEPSTPPSPNSPLSSQSPLPEPSSKGQLDCGSCPCVTGAMNYNACRKCCWTLYLVHLCVQMFYFFPFIYFSVNLYRSVLFLQIFISHPLLCCVQCHLKCLENHSAKCKHECVWTRFVPQHCLQNSLRHFGLSPPNMHVKKYSGFMCEWVNLNIMTNALHF